MQQERATKEERTSAQEAQPTTNNQQPTTNNQQEPKNWLLTCSLSSSQPSHIKHNNQLAAPQQPALTNQNHNHLSALNPNKTYQLQPLCWWCCQPVTIAPCCPQQPPPPPPPPPPPAQQTTTNTTSMMAATCHNNPPPKARSLLLLSHHTCSLLPCTLFLHLTSTCLPPATTEQS